MEDSRNNEELARLMKQVTRGVMQANARLTTLLERTEGSAGSPENTCLLPPDPLLELLQAVDDCLQASSTALVRAPSPWWRRWFGGDSTRSATGELREGLELARQRAMEQLEGLGLLPTPESGPPDPLLHQVIALEEPRPGHRPGEIAQTHRRGWFRRTAGEARAVRIAQVSVYKEIS